MYIYIQILYLDTHTHMYIYIHNPTSKPCFEAMQHIFHPQKFPPEPAGKNTNGCQVRTWPEFAALRDIMFFWKYFL